MPASTSDDCQVYFILRPTLENWTNLFLLGISSLSVYEYCNINHVNFAVAPKLFDPEE